MSNTTPQFNILQFSGADVKTFLQGQITQDTRLFNPHKALMGAYCNHKGRVLANMLWWQEQEVVYALLPSDIAASVAKRLQMFVLRADVKIGIVDRLQYQTMAHTEAPFTVADQRLYFSHQRVLTWDATQDPQTPDTAWLLADIQDHLPWITQATQDLFIPQFLDLEQFEAINYRKGCYVGQEVVARTHYRGTVKRGLFHQHFDHLAPFTAGQDLVLDDNPIGQIVNIVYHDQGVDVLYVAKHD